MKLAFSQPDIITTAKSLGLPTDVFIQRRVARAFDLVETNKVSQIDDGIFRVRSQYDPDKAYIVNVNSGDPSCDCPDSQQRTIHCKHRIASLLYVRLAKSLTIYDDTENSYLGRGRWIVTDHKARVKYIIYRDKYGRLHCPCNPQNRDCEHKKAIREYLDNLTSIANGCGSELASALQDKLNSQLDSQNNNGNGTHNVPSQDDIDPLSKPFVESDKLDEQQILTGEGGNVHVIESVTELKANIEKYTKKQQRQIEKLDEYTISYNGIMALADKYGILTATREDTPTRQRRN